MSEPLPPSANRAASTGSDRPRDSIADWLDRVLVQRRVEQAHDYLDDAGFTARVMARLPARVEPARWRRPVLALLWVAALAGLAVTLPPTMLDVARGAVRLFAGKPFALSDVAVLLAIAGTAMWAATFLTWRRA